MTGLEIVFGSIATLGTIFGIAAAAIPAIAESRRRERSGGQSWDDALKVVYKILSQIRREDWRPDLVIGLGRSGGIWGGWLAGNLGSLPFTVVDVRYADDGAVTVEYRPDLVSTLAEVYPALKTRATLRVLVVEGATSTGRTPEQFRQVFRSELTGWDVRTAILFVNPASTAAVDYIGCMGPEPWPRRFPWHLETAWRTSLRDFVRRS